MENNILKNDIKQLKNENQKLKKFETIELIKQNEEKDKKISELKKLNKEQKVLSDDFKYEKIIQNLKKELSKKEETINNLLKRIVNLRLKKEETKNNNININNIFNNYTKSAEKNKRKQMRSNSELNIIKEEKNTKTRFYASGKNFYKLFDEKERKAINRLFQSTEDLNNFKVKIDNIQKRNNNVELMLKNENVLLLKKNKQKDDKIKALSEKEKQNLRTISECKNQIKNNKNINNKLEKQLKKQNDNENNYKEIIKQKEEEIRKLTDEKNKLIETIKQSKEDIDKINIMKNKEKDIQSFRDELGVINVIDVEKILKIDKKFPSFSLSIQKNEDISFISEIKSSVDKITEIQEEVKERKEKKEKTNKKKKKKTKEEKKDGEKSGNIKLCKKEKK